jgi:hypothetical protein
MILLNELSIYDNELSIDDINEFNFVDNKVSLETIDKILPVIFESLDDKNYQNLTLKQSDEQFQASMSVIDDIIRYQDIYNETIIKYIYYFDSIQLKIILQYQYLEEETVKFIISLFEKDEISKNLQFLFSNEKISESIKNELKSLIEII